jgi:dTDP-4-amino-4,6-dideoxygalactose transaminase
MNELQAAVGLLQLRDYHTVQEKRRHISNLYRTGLDGTHGIECLNTSKEISSNYSYFPILVQSDYPERRDQLYERLKSKGIYCRRYFYPLISDFPMYRGLPSAFDQNLSIARMKANEILCLPIFPDLSDCVVNEIIELIRERI